ncbi:MAG: thymidine phosphorylase [Nanoarchaeota archaeon]
MKLFIKRLRFSAERPICMIHADTAKELSLHVGNRVLIDKGKKDLICSIDTIDGIVNKKEIAVSEDVIEKLNLKSRDLVNVDIIKKPLSIDLIKKKLEGHRLTKKEIYEIIRDIANNSLTEVEIAFFVSAVYIDGMTTNELKNLTEAMVEIGNKLKLKGKIFDKHCIGGVAGNRTTPIVVSICAAAGLIIPKTSSRAITSAAGTADVIETIAKVEFSISEIKEIVKKTNACLVWGGALGLAPTDDQIIKIERIVNIDSKSQLLASILSKKISVGSKNILIDIPFGKSAKVSKKEAKILKREFLKISNKFDLNLKVLMTDGSEPIGNGIGPKLEMQDVINVLSRTNSPKDLEEKSIKLSAELLKLAGKNPKIAKEILYSGKAYKKFLEIIKSQKGDINLLKKLKPKFIYNIKSKSNSRIKHIDNELINRLARQAGCPEDKAAGIYIYKKKNNSIKKEEKILTILTTSKEKMEHAKNFYKKNDRKIIEFH